MKFIKCDPPRVFEVGSDPPISIRHTADVQLDDDEQLALVTESGSEYDIVRKSWGYYATPSLNDRLVKRGLRASLVRNSAKKLFLLLADVGKEEQFFTYLDCEGLQIVCWLDSDDAVDHHRSHRRNAA